MQIGDVSDNGQVTIVDEDRLCYIVKSNSRGSIGLRTISKALLDEFIAFFSENPDANSIIARDALSGNSEIDKFEYGYTSTLTIMARMAIEGAKRQSKVTSKKQIIAQTLQQIFYGAPGTGKSHKIKDNAIVKNADEKQLVFRTTFHPDSDYSTFVGAYKPTMKPVADKYKAVAGKDEEITYSFVPQAFLQAYVAAWNNPEESVFLIIEEIDRGNCAQIFGDLFQLLDRDDDGYSEYSIMADNDLAKYLKGKDDKGQDVLINMDGIKDGKLKLPKNLYIWATMNTSDQSLFPIDSAFKRRWEWEYMPIGYKNVNWTIEIGKKNYNWVDFQREINNRIYDVDNSEDKQLGDYFVNADRTDNKISSSTLLNKILFYIWNDVCKDDPDQIFRWKDDKDNNQEKSIKFSDFFCDESERDRKLQGFMSFLGVRVIETNDSTENISPTEKDSPIENDIPIENVAPTKNDNDVNP